jgi:hypothetical protein
MLNFASFQTSGTLAGRLQWDYRTLDPSNTPIPATAELDVVGSRYAAPIAGAPLVGAQALPLAFTLRDDANGPVTVPATFSPATGIIFGQQGGITVSLNVNRGTGYARGTIVDSGANLTRDLSGVVLQSEVEVWGIDASPVEAAQSWAVQP